MTLVVSPLEFERQTRVLRPNRQSDYGRPVAWEPGRRLTATGFGDNGGIQPQTSFSFLETPEYRQLRWAGLAEGISFLLLLGIAMPLKYLAGQPQYVRMVGSVHGLLFVVYVLLVMLAAQAAKWPRATVLMALVAAVIPFGPFWFDAKLRKGLPQQ